MFCDIDFVAFRVWQSSYRGRNEFCNIFLWPFEVGNHLTDVETGFVI